ncbi:GGDEF domain-containing protein, partial [Thauera propionica]
EADVFARLGGEEFAVLLPCVDDAAGAVRAAERVRDLIASTPAIVDDVPLPFSVSIGVAMLDADDAGFDAVFTRADEALYEAKRGGRNRTVLSAPKEEAGSALESTEPA